MPSEAAEPLVIQGIKVDPRLLEARSLRRCRPGVGQSYCCGGGACISLAQMDDILAHADLFQAYLAPERCNPEDWFCRDETHEDTDHPAGGLATYAAVFDDPLHPYTYSCIFLRPDRKYALQLPGSRRANTPGAISPSIALCILSSSTPTWSNCATTTPFSRKGGVVPGLPPTP